MMRKTRLAGYLLMVLVGALSSLAPVQAQEATHVDLLRIKGAVSPVVVSYVGRGVRVAESDGAQCLIIVLDTPGGQVDLTNEIVQAISGARVPVVVYVSPTGAMAASAGTLITLAGHVAAMAPGTSIGAASPVGIQGEDLQETAQKKAEEIIAASARALARRRGEEAAEWASAAVTEAKGASAEEALEMGVVDFVADDLPSLLDQLDGFEVEVWGETVTLHTAGATVNELPMNPIEGFLHTITNPNIAFILLTIGLNAILFELSSPGGYVAGIIGVVCLLLALYALGTLNPNWAGLAFIALAFVLFIADVKAPTHGVLTAGGLVSFIFGALILFQSPYQAVSRPLIISVGLSTAAFFAFAVSRVVGAQRLQVVTGGEGLIGEMAVARTPLAPEGTVFLKGERWDAVAEDGSVEEGQRVSVVAREGFRLRVKRAKREEREE